MVTRAGVVAGWGGGIYALSKSTAHPLLCALSGFDESAPSRAVKTSNGCLGGGRGGGGVHTLRNNTLRSRFVWL